MELFRKEKDLLDCTVQNDKFEEECGVFAVFNNDDLEVARATYYGLYALQHRGQESAGIAVSDNGTIIYHKDMGLVPEIFNDVVLNHLSGQIAVGHVRYSTTGASYRENAQPMVIKYKNGQLALAHNGNLVNAKGLRYKMEENGTLFQSSNDSEIILNLLVKYSVTENSLEAALEKAMKEIKGSYALAIMSSDKLIAMRDSYGIRPLCIGKYKDSYIISSESCALDAVGAKFVRDVEPGEIIRIDKNGLTTLSKKSELETKLCVFEHIYFARPDSFIDGASVHQSRIEAGRILARDYPVEADVVIGVPDSGLTAAIGYSRESGIPYGQGLIKNRYVGRTFIKPDQGQRDISVKIKLNALRDEVDGKRVVMIDDSIVRGTTSKRIVQILREAGAKEVHMRISSPPVKYSCYYGIDTPNREHLVAAKHTVAEISDMLGTDSLAYLSVEGLMKTPVGSKCGFCNACFTGVYPVDIPELG